MSPSRPGRSLFWWVAGLILLAALAGSAIQAVVAVAVLRPFEIREQRARAELAASQVAAAIATLPDPEREGAIDTLLVRARAGMPRPAPWIVFRAEGRVVATPSVAARAVDAVPGEAPNDRSEARTARSRTELLHRHEVVRGSRRLGEILMVRPRPRERLGPNTARAMLLFLPIALLTSGLAGLWIVRVLVRRLRALETLAARVAEGDLSVRVADTSGDEIGRLAERLDWMADRLHASREQLERNELQRRQLFADITHELATPLTSIRGYAETLLDPDVSVSAEERSRYMRLVLGESRRLDRLIRDLFELARLEAGAAPLQRERLDFGALIGHTVERFEPRFRDAGLALSWRAPLGPAWVEADGRRLEQVLDNLLNNALRYVPGGGTVELALARAGDAHRLTVSDDGPGLAEEELPKVFERFYRAETARGEAGSGLGLAIVREIVERHGGAVSARRREPRGLVIEVDVPVAAELGVPSPGGR